MTKRKFVTLLATPLAIAVVHGWTLYRFFGLELVETRSMTVPLSFFLLITGWMGAAFYAVALSGKTRWRGTMRSLASVFTGTLGLSLEGRSEIWSNISLVGLLIAVVLSFLPITLNKVGSEF